MHHNNLEVKDNNSVFITVLFVAFLFSGQFRPLIGAISPLLALLPLVIPLFICFACFLYYCAFKHVSFSRELIQLNGIILFITSLLVLSATFTPSESHYLDKLGQWFILVFAFLFPQVVKLHRNAFIYGFCVASLGVFVVFWLSAKFSEFFVFLEPELLRHLSTLYLTAGNYLATAFILVFFLKRNFILLAGLFLLLLMTGARGPLIFLLICLFVWAFASGKIILRAKTVIALVAIVSSIVAAGVFFELAIFERLLLRFGTLFQDGGGSSISARFNYLNQAFSGIEQSPILGNGIGSFGFITTGVDYKEYPHNLLVEAWFDIGLVGMLAFFTFFLAGNYMSLTQKYWALFVIVNYFLLNSLKSSSYVDHRVMMAVMAFLMVQHRKKLF